MVKRFIRNVINTQQEGRDDYSGDNFPVVKKGLVFIVKSVIIKIIRLVKGGK